MTFSRLLALALVIATTTSTELEEATNDCKTNDEPSPELVFLQVDTNITARERLATHAAALVEIADEINASELAAAATVLADQKVLADTYTKRQTGGHDHGKHRKFNFSPKPFSLTSLYRNVQQLHAKSGVAASGAAVALGLSVVLVLCCFCFFAFSWASSDPQGKPFSAQQSVPPGAIGSQRTMPARSYQQPAATRPRMDGAVPPPILCKELVLPNTEARFQIDMTELMDASSSSFPIMSPSGKTLLQAILTEGRILSICSAGQSTPRILIRAGTGSGPPMLAILAADGASFGKISEGPFGKGLVLYHMNRPSVILQVNDISKLEMTAIPMAGPIAGPCATLSRSGSSLRLQVRPGQDAILYLASFLAVLQLEPKLMDRAAGITLEEVMQP